VPILFTSGYPANEIARRELLEPGRPYLPKPFAPSTLAQTVQELLQGRR
jgi:CheY-like chemotaxis protein